MNKGLKTWLFWAFISAAVFGPLVVGGFNQLLDAQYSAQPVSLPVVPSQEPQTVCTPGLHPSDFEQLDSLILSQENDSAVSLRMAQLFSADQAARQLPVSDPLKLKADDAARRVEVLEYIRNGQIRSAPDLVHAAFIFQHGDCSEHYRFANRLAQIAMQAGYSEARWIYAATFDRYLMSMGQPQKFGTQYTWVDGEYQLYPVDPTTSDAEREQYNVPSLSEISQTKPADNSAGNVVSTKRWLESWWLTLIGVAFALLGALISLIEAKPNPWFGKAVLVMTLAIYALSILGHNAQLNALAHGTFEAQKTLWGTLNILMLVVWVMLGCMGAYRWLRIKSAQPNRQSR